jgi:acetyltransferase-like isoleucine patch superfamily enzyme
MSIKFPEDSGVTIAGKVPPLHSDSWFEPPIVVQTTLASMNLIQISAFTGIYGGRLGHCKIGRYCSIAYDVDIASDQHPIDWVSSSMVQYVPDIHGWGDWLKRNNNIYCPPTASFKSNAPVEIGNDVWIGQGVFIKSGIKIGDGAVVSAHSVVVNDIPSYSIVVGNPAVVKKMRFDQATIEKLLELKWWDYNITSIKDIDFRNINSALETLASKIKNKELLPYTPTVYREN